MKDERIRHTTRQYLVAAVVLLALILSPCHAFSESCDLQKLEEAKVALHQNGDILFKFWAWSHVSQLRRLFDEVGGDKDLFMFRAVQMYTHSKFSKVADKGLFVAKISLFATVMWAVAYVQSTWFTEGPAQNFISAVLGGVVFSFVHPFLGPVYEKIYNKARIDSFRSMTDKVTTLDPWLLKRFSEYYKRTNAALNAWQIWTRDDIGILLIGLRQYIQQTITLYIAYKGSTGDPSNPFSKEESFHDPIALALIFFARVYPDYAAEPDFIFSSNKPTLFNPLC